MRAELPTRPVREGTDLLAWGLAISCLLVVLSTVFSALEVSRARREVLVLFREGERATYLLGHVGKQLAIIHATLREAAAARGETMGPADRAFEALEEEVQRTLRELPALLGPNVARAWVHTGAELQRVAGEFEGAARALERGDTGTASAILDRTAPRTADVLKSLASLSEANREEIELLFGQAEHRLRLLRRVELLAGGILLIGLVLVWTRVSRIIRTQRRDLDEYVRKVEVANAELDAFAGRVAHDLRNAFGPVGLAASIAKGAARAPDRVAAVAERMERATRRAMTLIDGMLAFSRAGKPSDASAVSSVAEEVRASLDELAPLAERVRATVEVAASEDVYVATSPGLLHVVVGNVLNNALKFLEGREQRIVRIGVRAEDATWGVLSVEDTGPGIPEASLPKLFEPFYRVPGTKISGTGIGLATVDRIVRAHGGRVRVASVLGKGSRFEVRLPLARVALGAPAV